MAPQPPEVKDNVSIANSEVILRHPQQLGRYASVGEPSRSGVPHITHSHSANDLFNYRQPYGRPVSKDHKTVILPISPTNRPRSHISSTYSQTNDGLQQFMVNPYDNSYQNLNRSPTPQERFAPYTSGDGGGNSGYDNGGFILNHDFEPYKPNRLTTQTSSSSTHQLPTSPEAKKRMFTDILSTSTSIIYAILVLTLGISFYVIDYIEIEDKSVTYAAEGFSLTLIGIALLYLIYLITDITVYKRKTDKFEKLMDNLTPEHIELKETNEGIACDVTLQKALALKKQLDHRYCFNMDRHSSNFYLKVGAAGFCFGHLIHSFLILTYRGVIMNSPDTNLNNCLNTATFVLEILYPIYSILLLFFIFKYSNVIINKYKDFHRFGFMHCLAASLCFWIWTIFRETTEYIQYQKNYTSEDKNGSVIVESAEIFKENTEKKMLTSIVPLRFTKMCEDAGLNVIYQSYSPYLYPFSVEYSILVVGILYIVWINIGLCHSSPADEGHHGEDIRECKNHKPIERESNVTIHADCHASNKGLFGGFIVLVFAIVSTILFFITYNSSDNTDIAKTGLVINSVTASVVMGFMIIAAIFAYAQMVKLDINEAAHNSLDNFLCLMCLPAFFINGLFSIIPAIVYGNVLAVIDVTFEIIQVLIQTPFIIDGMARSSNTKDLRKKKPGRELVMFLLICNVAMWIMQTFEVKSHGLDPYRQEFYSKEFWSIVGHICLPLMMFYRFHASVCIGDIWKFAYVPSGH